MSGAGLGNTVVKIDITGRGRVQLDAAGTRGGFNPLFRRRGAGGANMAAVKDTIELVFARRVMVN